MNAFQLAFLECALWSSTESEEDGNIGPSLDDNYDTCDFDPASLTSLLKDCEDFCESNAELLEQAGDDAQNGHDFWLTRNGHEAGFWDRGYGAVGDELSKASKVYGSVDLYVHEGKVFAS
jgi:hypothetical protein